MYLIIFKMLINVTWGVYRLNSGKKTQPQTEHSGKEGR